jgi:kynureninase
MSPEGARKRIVVTSLDFHSSLHLWCAQERRGFEIVVVPTRDQMSVDSADVVAAIDERTSIVAVSLVSRNSALLNVGPVIRRAREVGALVALDAYQAVGIYPLDPIALDVDVLVGGCLKWLSGETGLAFMYVKPELAERLEPGYPGWFGHQELHAFVHTHAFVDKFRSMPGARRFQQGTPPVEPIYGSRAGLRFVLEVGVEAMRRRNNELTDYLLAGSLKRGFDVRTPHPTSERAGGICLGAPDPEKVVEALAREGIDVDQRRQLLVRLAPHPCCTVEDCESVLDAFGRATASS